MMSSSVTSADIVAALRLQQEWGVDELVQDEVWHPIAPPPRRLQQPSVASPKARPKVQRGLQSQEATLLKAENSDELIRLSEQIDGLSLAKTAMHRLNPVYVSGAPFVLVGEVPDADEDRSGRLFSGQAGQLLDKVLASIDLKRDQLSMMPAIPWRPPGGQRVATRELHLCRPILQRSLALAQPRRVVTMGTTPVQLLLDSSVRLNQVRGRWTTMRLPGVPHDVSLLPMVHPLKLVGGEGIRRNFWQDLLLLAETLEQDAVAPAL